MKLSTIVNALRNTTSPLARDQTIPDDQTTDKQLRGLRRQRRVQLEEFEKERLQQEILAHQRKRAAEGIVGDGKNPLKYNGVGYKLGKMPKQQGFYQKGYMLRRKG